MTFGDYFLLWVMGAALTMLVDAIMGAVGRHPPAWRTVTLREKVSSLVFFWPILLLGIICWNLRLELGGKK